MQRKKGIKICGLTQLKDVLLVQNFGADYYGFILYEDSPRNISIELLKKLIKPININQCVIVDVLPSLDKLKLLNNMGFNNFQIHIPKNSDFNYIESFSKTIGKSSLWLAPELNHLSSFEPKFLDFADTIIIDSYSKSKIGGTGKPGDWIGFKHLNEKYPMISWGLAGGLKPENIKEAQDKSGASLLDINSGIEISPGIKDPKLIELLFKSIT